MNGFSTGSLHEIQKLLDEIPHNNPHFHAEVSETVLKASFGYGESIEIRFAEGRYTRTRRLERSIIVDECEDEAMAIHWFAQSVRLGMQGF